MVSEKRAIRKQSEKYLTRPPSGLHQIQEVEEEAISNPQSKCTITPPEISKTINMPNEATVEETAAMVKAAGGDMATTTADVSVRAACHDAVADCVAAFGRLDVLGNIAGIARAEGLDSCVFLPPVAKSALGPVTASFGCGLMVLKDVPEFRRGTSPNKFFDYLAAGVPVINNYPGWVADLVAEHGCGVVVPPGDPVAFADALQRLAADPAACRAMGAAARRLAEERFARRSLAADFCAALESAARL